jgi:hypothetical protein
LGTSKPPEGIGGLIVGAISALGIASPLRWRLDASLNLPMAFDINKKLSISVA